MKNITKYKSENIRIRCEISGNPLPRYKWYKDDVPIRENEDRINSKLTPWGARWVVPLDICLAEVFKNYRVICRPNKVLIQYWKYAVNGKFICIIKMQSNYQEVKNAFKQKKVKNVCYLKFGSTLVKKKKKKISIFKLKFNYKNYKKKNILFFITTVLTSWEFSLRDLVGQYICMLHQTGFIVLCFSAKQMCVTIKYILTALLYRHQISELENYS